MTNTSMSLKLLAVSAIAVSAFSALSIFSLPGTLPGAMAVPKVAASNKDGSTKKDIEKDKDKDPKRIVHVLNRLAFGPKPGDIKHVEEIGIEAYIREQLHPENLETTQDLKNIDKFTALTENPSTLFLNYGKPALKGLQLGTTGKEEDKKKSQEILRKTYRKLFNEAATARLVRGIESPRQLNEVMTDFWFNHFNVCVDKGLDHLWIGAYEEKAIRPHVLGRFRDIVGATAHHAAMLFYLDNWQNTDPNAKNARGRFKGLNENYARELMELHTLGVDGGYKQKDVIELARVLTGLGLQQKNGMGQQMRNMAAGAMARNRRIQQGKGVQQFDFNSDAKGNSEFGYYFDERRHDFNDKILLGYKIKGSGEKEIEEALDLLCKHPSTAKHISYKLAQYFVADKPPEKLVSRLAKTFLSTDGNISAVLDDLFHSPEFYDSKYYNAKFKSPYRYLLSTFRAVDARTDNVLPLLAFLKQTGQPLYQCLTPDGYKNTQSAWLNPDGLLHRLNFATQLGTGKFFGTAVGVYQADEVLEETGLTLSEKSRSAIENAAQPLKTGLVLGSPEFMMY